MDRKTIYEGLQKNQVWLEKAIIRLVENNHFHNPTDECEFKYYARWIKSGKHLSGRFLVDAKKRIAGYDRYFWALARMKEMRAAQKA